MYEYIRLGDSLEKRHPCGELLIQIFIIPTAFSQLKDKSLFI